jgi:hypothetical protein
MAKRSKRKRARRETVVRPPQMGADAGAEQGSDRDHGTSPHPNGGADPLPVGRRQKVVSLCVAGVLLASLVAGIVVFADGGGDSAGVEVADGTVVDADQDSLLFRPSQPIDGESEIELLVRDEDRGEKLDPEHLLYHASTGGAMRIYYEREGEDYFAREAYDLPGLP